MVISLLNVSLRPACLVGVLCLLTIHKVESLSYGHYLNSQEGQAVPREVIPLKFPGYLFVPFANPLNSRTIDQKEGNSFEGLDEDVVNNFIDEFIHERYLDLMKDEIVSHYAKYKGQTSSFLPFDVDSLTNYDMERGLLNYDDDRRHRVCGSCAPGYPGHRGNPGRPGVPGPFGDKGNLGPRGFKGDQGLKGIKGIRQKGVKGDKGFKGRKGELGDPGSKGIKGQKLKGFKGTHTHGPAGDNLKGFKGIKGHNELCCDPGLFDTESGKCYFHVEEETSYQNAEDICHSKHSAQIVTLTSALVTRLNTITNFLDEAGTNIWSNTGAVTPSGSCNVWDFSTDMLDQEPCLFPNDFICFYTSSICPPFEW